MAQEEESMRVVVEGELRGLLREAREREMMMADEMEQRAYYYNLVAKRRHAQVRGRRGYTNHQYHHRHRALTCLISTALPPSSPLPCHLRQTNPFRCRPSHGFLHWVPKPSLASCLRSYRR